MANTYTQIHIQAVLLYATGSRSYKKNGKRIYTSTSPASSETVTINPSKLGVWLTISTSFSGCGRRSPFPNSCRLSKGNLLVGSMIAVCSTYASLGKKGMGLFLTRSLKCPPLSGTSKTKRSTIGKKPLRKSTLTS